MAKNKDEKLDLDLNKDGVFDGKDKSLAAKALATKLPEKDVEEKEEVKDEAPVEPEAQEEEKKAPKEEEKEEVKKKEGDMVAVKDISRKYRKGSVVPKEQIAKWVECGIDYKVWF